MHIDLDNVWKGPRRSWALWSRGGAGRMGGGHANGHMADGRVGDGREAQTCAVGGNDDDNDDADFARTAS